MDGGGRNVRQAAKAATRNKATPKCVAEAAKAFGGNKALESRSTGFALGDDKSLEAC